MNKGRRSFLARIAGLLVAAPAMPAVAKAADPALGPFRITSNPPRLTPTAMSIKPLQTCDGGFIVPHEFAYQIMRVPESTHRDCVIKIENAFTLEDVMEIRGIT